MEENTPQISKSTFRYTALALKILEKVLHSRFSVEGANKLPDKPILFVANHFTRAETFFMPYLINKYTKRTVRCLGDSSLFHGILGRYLRSLGTVSTKQPHRDTIILHDLITGEYDWMIYPEGSMVKSKEIKKEQYFISHTPNRTGTIRTGATVLGLKSELYRSEIVDAFEKKNEETLNGFRKGFDIEYSDSLRDLNTYIVPVNITYYPIRGGDNPLKKLISRLVKKIPRNIAEEIEIESNLLLNSEINIFFGNPINLGDYVAKARGVIYQIPIIKNETKSNFVLKYFKHRLTHNFMKEVYLNTQINFDHIFSAAIYHCKENIISIDHLKRIIYISGVMINKTGRYRINNSLLEENLVKLFIDEPHKAFDGVFKIAIDSGVIERISDNKIKINKNRLLEKSDFQYVRLENTLQVILNEFLLLETSSAIVRRNCEITEDALKERVKSAIFNTDLENFANDYKKYFDEKTSKNKLIGAPIFLEAKTKSTAKVKKEIGVVICHGYKANPKEVTALAQYVNDLDFCVYCPRLKGHGTAPINIKDASWEDWYDSLQRGYAAIRNSHDKIVLIGFSTGGLLSLLSATRKNSNNLISLISINAALKINDIRARFIPTVSFWNELLDKLNIEKAKLEFVDDIPENPEINYSRNYIKGVEELQKLMKICYENLHSINIPTLVIQAKHDPVVNPESGKILYEKITAKNKELFELNFSNHVIINSERKEEVFTLIGEFLQKL